MKKVIAPLTVFFALILNSSFAQTELQAGAQYQAGSSVKSTYFGVNIKIPNGITAGYNEQDGKQVLTGATPDGSLVFLMLFQHGVSPQTYNNLLTQPMPIGEITLQPSSVPSSMGVQTADLERGITGQTTVLGGANSSLLLIAFATQDKEAQVVGLINAFRANTKFGKSLAGNGEAKARNDWTQFLSGKLLVRSGGSSSNSVNGTGNSSSDKRLGLCSDQRFSYSSRSGVFISAGGSDASSVSKDESQGRWVLEYVNQNGAILTLTDESGLQRRMNLRVAGEFVVIDGQGWQISNAGC